ncbi:DUF397 domain-containing protein [Actinoplanes rectilineatus]|uniref:DUF397 domain-containing protein n=1 Tax=Actinoplanes rectilineatus TaxID=113571 RepID=UPI0005F2EA66|nr:DUF397 domain-containing protein [Actinoplanes rectilineatus]
MLKIGVPHKSSRSGAAGQCVEVELQAAGGIVVRDTKNPGGAALTYTGGEWDAFVEGVKAGEFDRPAA